MTTAKVPKRKPRRNAQTISRALRDELAAQPEDWERLCSEADAALTSGISVGDDARTTQRRAIGAWLAEAYEFDPSGDVRDQAIALDQMSRRHELRPKLPPDALQLVSSLVELVRDVHSGVLGGDDGALARSRAAFRARLHAKAPKRGADVATRRRMLLRAVTAYRESRLTADDLAQRIVEEIDRGIDESDFMRQAADDEYISTAEVCGGVIRQTDPSIRRARTHVSAAARLSIALGLFGDAGSLRSVAKRFGVTGKERDR